MSKIKIKKSAKKKSSILDFNIEQIKPNEFDYKLVEEARKKRENGEKIYSFEEVIKKFRKKQKS